MCAWIFELEKNIFPILRYKDGKLYGKNPFMGTGFLIHNNSLITCMHCIPDELKSGEKYVILQKDNKPCNLENIIYHPNGYDLAYANVSLDPQAHAMIAQIDVGYGDSVYTIGYPLNDAEILGDGSYIFEQRMRYLEGCITRISDYPRGRILTPSFELSFAIPIGASGSPLVRRGTMEIVGVIYGDHRTGTVLDEIEEESKNEKIVKKTSRIISFGLAHRTDALREILKFALTQENVIKYIKKH